MIPISKIANNPLRVEVRRRKVDDGAGGLLSRQEKLGKGGSDVGSITETFRWNPVGNQSHPVELGQQPEASLAWTGSNPGCEA
jgi:hypothetical protein